VVVSQGSGTNSNVYTVFFGGTLGNVAGPVTALPQLVPAIVPILPAATGTVVISNTAATLALQQNGATVSMQHEPLTLVGPGVGGVGALENLTSNASSNNDSNIWDTPITLAGAAVIGTAAGSTLTLNQAPINDGINPATGVSNGFGLTKVGSGTLQETGTAGNSYTGITQVNDGTLQLGIDTSGGAVVVPGNLVVGDGSLTPGSATVQMQSDLEMAGGLLGTAAITINSDGVLDLGNTEQAIGALTMKLGEIGWADEPQALENAPSLCVSSAPQHSPPPLPLRS